MPPLIITEANFPKVYGPSAEHWQGRQLAAHKPLRPRLFQAGKLYNCPLNTTEIPLIPRSEWRAIYESQKNDSLLTRTAALCPIHDQGRTNFCWAHGPVRAFELLTAISGRPARRLSSASVAVPITGGRNIGGWPEKALMQMQSQGACPLSVWPDDQYRAMPDPTVFNRTALPNRMMKWVELQTFDEIFSAVCRFIPAILPLLWWSHVVVATAPYIDDDGNPGVWIDNSWGTDWSEGGRAILMERKATPEQGAFAPLEIGFSL